MEVGRGIGNCPLSKRFSLARVNLPEGEATRRMGDRLRTWLGLSSYPPSLNPPVAALSGPHLLRFSNRTAAAQKQCGAEGVWGFRTLFPNEGQLC